VKLPFFSVKTRNFLIMRKKEQNLLLNSKTVFTFIAAYALNRYPLEHKLSRPIPSINIGFQYIIIFLKQVLIFVQLFFHKYWFRGVCIYILYKFYIQ